MSPAVYVQTNDATGNEVIAFSSSACVSGNHLREPPCKLLQAPQGISRHGFRSSTA